MTANKTRNGQNGDPTDWMAEDVPAVTTTRSCFAIDRSYNSAQTHLSRVVKENRLDDGIGDTIV
jgi:hypothetical protein